MAPITVSIDSAKYCFFILYNQVSINTEFCLEIWSFFHFFIKKIMVYFDQGKKLNCKQIQRLSFFFSNKDVLQKVKVR